MRELRNERGGIYRVVGESTTLHISEFLPADFELLRDEIAARTGLEWQPKTTQRTSAPTV